MRTIAVLLLAFAAASYAADEVESSFAAATAYTMGGGCPNECSGRGYCRADAKCFCFQGWLGYDCSKRECPSYPAWGADNAVLHTAVECAYRGVCNRKSGECECFSGYSGASCERTDCPNDCSGHGKCRFISELPKNTASAWDSSRIQTCVCDGGYMGSDCSLRMCPYGNDPQSICTETDAQVQKISLAFTPAHLTGAKVAMTGADISGDFAMRFTDSHGNVWKTGAVTGLFAAAVASNANTATSVKGLLTGLPNYAVDAVSVTSGSASGANILGTDTSLDLFVTFSGERTSGEQPLLQCAVDNGCPFSGCQPKYGQLRAVKSAVASGGAAGHVALASSYVTQPSTAGNQHNAGVVNLMVVVAGTSGARTYQYKMWDETGTEVGATYSTAYKVPTKNCATKGVDVGRGLTITFGNSCNPDAGEYHWSVATPSCSVAVEDHAGEHNENIECSNRGICDRTSGMCQCFDGYSGYACNQQSLVV